MWWLNKWMRFFTEDETAAGTDFHWISRFQGVASFSGSLTVKMSLGGSGLNWVWKRPLGVVFDRTCSEELGEPFGGWSVLRQTSLLQNPWGGGRRDGVIFRKHDMLSYGHLTTWTSRHWSTDTTQDFCPIVPQYDRRRVGKVQNQGRLNVFSGVQRAWHSNAPLSCPLGCGGAFIPPDS